MTNIRLEYFAILRERTGCEGEDIATSAETVAELFGEISQRYQFPEMARMKVAINDEFADWSARLSEGDSVVFIPPVAGG